MKTKLITVGIITAVFGLLILNIQDPFFLAGGSDSLELTAAPSAISQWVALLLFFIISTLYILIPSKKNRFVSCFKSGALIVSVFLLIISGHSYTYSGRQHALIDSWYFMPLQTLSVNPQNFLNNGEYMDNQWYVSLYENGQVKQRIITWPFFWGINKSHVIDILKHVGAIERKQK